MELEYKSHIGYRLKPRCVVRGGYADHFALYWTKNKFPNEKFVYLDTNGLFSYVSIKYPFMIGKLQIIMGPQINKISIDNRKFYYEKRPILGTILLTIIPPKKLFLPFLLYRRQKDQKVYNTLCTICCENESLVCNHNDIERAITSAYMITEIEYALTLGYVIHAIHEVHIYVNFDFILRPFVQKVNFLKTQHSNCFEGLKTTEEKEIYCAKLNKQMDFTSPLILTPQNVMPNPIKRNFYKLLCNALFGKLEERHDKNKVIFASSNSEIESIYLSDKIIEDFYIINDSLCELYVKPNLLKLKPNRKSNCYLGAQVTAYARQTIHENALKIHNLNYKIFQVNCDSLLFSMPENNEIPFEISHAVGDFKFELNGEIQSYYSLGSKSYSITYKTPTNEIKNISKICGLTIMGQPNEKCNIAKIFKLYKKQFFFNENDYVKINQKRFKRDFKCKKIKSYFTNVRFSNQISTKRLVNLSDPYLTTFPFGFNP